MPSIDTLTAAIRDALEQIRAAAVSITASRTTAGEVRDRFTSLGAEGKARDTAAIVDAIEEQQAAAQTAIGHAETVLAQAEALRGGGGGGAPPGPPPVTPAAEPLRRDPSTIPPREGMAGIRPYEEAGTAEGNLFFATGRQNDRPLKATPGETKFKPGEVKPEWRHTKPAQGHIEGNAAADMLHTGETKASLFLNVQPCDYKGQGCKDNTAHYLKPGSVLDIKVYDSENRIRYRRRITGTGEALTDG
ncbi:DddA-like double-stranded DNA deaminase toxin [Glycomyces tenuis]|uniref:DddA-like double-stranded DNA deaminase toxin n=1 Tax=Glycomyces tenuis TaxID=58116 RepID=UPI000409240A|nr:DddA-like double-stranded DNA deaminase toxin [Glycomyces tenuis]